MELVLIKTKISRFYLMGEGGGEGGSQEQDPLSHLKTSQMGIFGFSQNWRKECCHGNKKVGLILFLLSGLMVGHRKKQFRRIFRGKFTEKIANFAEFSRPILLSNDR